MAKGWQERRKEDERKRGQGERDCWGRKGGKERKREELKGGRISGQQEEVKGGIGGRKGGKERRKERGKKEERKIGIFQEKKGRGGGIRSKYCVIKGIWGVSEEKFTGSYGFIWLFNNIG